MLFLSELMRVNDDYRTYIGARVFDWFLLRGIMPLWDRQNVVSKQTNSTKVKNRKGQLLWLAITVSPVYKQLELQGLGQLAEKIIKGDEDVLDIVKALKEGRTDGSW